MKKKKKFIWTWDIAVKIITGLIMFVMIIFLVQENSLIFKDAEVLLLGYSQ